MQNSYIIRNMTKNEVADIAIEWAANEGWNPGLHDLEAFFATDHEGYFAGFLENQPISCISAVKYNDSFGFIGFYIVKPEYRSLGYGFRLWETAIKSMPTQNIGLDGVIAQQSNYIKSGFKLAYRNIRYGGISNKARQNFNDVVELSDVAFNEILEYDSKHFPTLRTNFIKPWLKQPESQALATIHDGKITGYGLIRKCRTGYKIGPLFADNKLFAEKLFISLCRFVESGTPIFLDTPELNPSAMELAENHGMQKVFETARMYTKSQPALDLTKIYGITTFELG